MDTNNYLTFLLCAVLLVLIDGQILYLSGSRYLRRFRQVDDARSAMQLVAVLFHLVVLGVVALISTIDVSTGLPARDLIVKLGLVLLILAAAHGSTMAILARLRGQFREEQIEEGMVTDPTSASAPQLNRSSVTDHEAGEIRPSNSRSPIRYPD